MYLLLTIYSIFNMNNVSWGTREAPKSDEEKAAENAEKAEAAKKKGKIAGIQDWARRFGSFSNFLSFSCCTADDNSEKLMMMEEKLDKKLGKIEEKLDQVIDEKTVNFRNGSKFSLSLSISVISHTLFSCPIMQYLMKLNVCFLGAFHE